jgi:hypothetical protein
MARITTVEVKEIMGADVPDAIINACIIAAEEVINTIYSGKAISSTLLAEIERWYTAHMVASTPNYRTTTDEKLGDAQVKYTGQFGKNLESTTYGQMVLTLDPTGTIQQNLGKAEARIYAVKSFNK